MATANLIMSMQLGVESTNFHPGQRVQFFRHNFWRLAQFITYAVIDGRQQAIVRTSRELGIPGRLQYMDPHYVHPVKFDAHGNAILNTTKTNSMNVDLKPCESPSELSPAWALENPMELIPRS
jgi:hypothetical protein